MQKPPNLSVLAAAVEMAPKSDMRLEAAILALFVVLPLLWLAIFFSTDWGPAGIVLLLAVVGTFVIPAVLLPWRLTPPQRRVLLNGGVLRLLLSPLLPRSLPWHGPGVLSADGDAAGLSAHARLAATALRRQPWRLVPGAWIGRAHGRICLWRRIEEGWILVASRVEVRPTSKTDPSFRSRA